MPDFSGSFRASDTWVTPGSASEVLYQLGEAVGAVPQGQVIEADLGSPLAMRLWGAFVPSARVPLRVKIEAAAADVGTRVMVEASSRQGRYVGQVRGLAGHAFDRGFTSLFSRLRAAAPPAA